MLGKPKKCPCRGWFQNMTAVVVSNIFSSWWFQIFFVFHPYLGKWSNLTKKNQLGWFNHQLVFMFTTTWGKWSNLKPPIRWDGLLAQLPNKSSYKPSLATRTAKEKGQPQVYTTHKRWMSWISCQLFGLLWIGEDGFCSLLFFYLERLIKEL